MVQLFPRLLCSSCPRNMEQMTFLLYSYVLAQMSSICLFQHIFHLTLLFFFKSEFFLITCLFNVQLKPDLDFYKYVDVYKSIRQILLLLLWYSMQLPENLPLLTSGVDQIFTVLTIRAADFWELPERVEGIGCNSPTVPQPYQLFSCYISTLAHILI